MDPRQFEDFSRRFARDMTRRGIARAAGGALALLLASGVRASEIEDEGIAVYSCRIPGQKCKRDRSCCSRQCKKKVCSCKPKGQPSSVNQEGGICCSKKCAGNGKCK